MQKVRNLYTYLKKVNEKESFLDDFPEIKDENNFQEFLKVLNNLMEKFGQKLVQSKTQQQQNSKQQSSFIPMENGTNEYTNQGQYNEQNGNYDQQEKQLQKEIFERKKTLQKLKDELQQQKKINKNLEKNLNLDSIKQKLSEQIDINSKMREKILLLNYLDDKLNLGFKEEIGKTEQAEVFEKVLKEKQKEAEILRNFSIIDQLKKKKGK